MSAEGPGAGVPTKYLKGPKYRVPCGSRRTIPKEARLVADKGVGSSHAEGRNADRTNRTSTNSGAKKADDLGGIANAKLNVRFCEELTARKNRITFWKSTAYNVIGTFLLGGIVADHVEHEAVKRMDAFLVDRQLRTAFAKRLICLGYFRVRSGDRGSFPSRMRYATDSSHPW